MNYDREVRRQAPTLGKNIDKEGELDPDSIDADPGGRAEENGQEIQQQIAIPGDLEHLVRKMRSVLFILSSFLLPLLLARYISVRTGFVKKEERLICFSILSHYMFRFSGQGS